MKRIGIEALLRWAYRDELPKDGAAYRLKDRPSAHGRAWEPVEEFGDLLTVVDGDAVNAWGLTPDYSAICEPDPVAVIVGQAVLALDAIPVILPPDWNPLAEMGDLGSLGASAVARALDRATALDTVGERRLKTSISWLVRRHALQGDCPVWQADLPEVKVERGANGTPRWFVRETLVGADGPYEVEVDGFDRKRRIPMPGAYQRSYLDPCPIDAAVARAEYEVWHAALAVLVEDLNPCLRTEGHAVEVLPCERAERPWVDGDLPSRRVLEVGAEPVVTWPLALWGGRGLKQMRANA